MTSNRWSRSEDAALTALYPDCSNDSLVGLFGRSKPSIQNRAFILGLKKTESHMKRVRDSTLFKIGHKSWNKGISHPSPGLSSQTQFKKGRKPKNWVPIGSERVTEDGYLWRKMTDTGATRKDFVQVHRLVWIEHTGKPIPKGHAIVFKDGNKRNLDISNLELLSRADLMRRNSVHTLPPDIKAQCMVLGGFNRKLRRIKREQSNG